MSSKTETKLEDEEFTVSDELYEISEATNSDGTVDVEVYGFEKTDDGNVRVMFHTPTREKKEEVMDWPKKDTLNNKFVRLCQETVGGLNGAKFLKTDGARIKADPDDWSIKTDISRRETFKIEVSNTSLSNIVSVGLISAGLGFIIVTGLWSLFAPAYALLTTLGWVPPFATTGSAWFIGWIVSGFSFMIALGITEE